MQSSKLAIVGGTSLLESDLFSAATSVQIETPYGTVTLLKGQSEFFLQRHGLTRYTPPHAINHHANMMALQMAGITHVIAVGSVGGMRPELSPGTILIPDDFFAPHLAPTYYDDSRGHLAPTFDLSWRQTLLDTWKQCSLPAPIDGGVYWQTIGPRFETRAEIAFYQPHVHVVGMTIASECILAAELGLSYAAICMIDNPANGVVETPLTFDSFKQQVRANEKQLVHIIQTLTGRVAP
ncbi:MAG: MTAP family purine nucleoside phosphorylase [Magnetococcales bacterium]|nr:MTAP family purine nucleoside phosphorylase [Magnetococcales bacterium]